MSLINDALKRATQTPTSAVNPSAREPHTPMQPVEYRRGSLPWYFFPTLLLILAGGVWFVVKGLETSRTPGGALTVHAREPQSDATPSAATDPSPDMLAASLLPGPSDNYVPPAQPPNRNFSLEDSPAPTPATPDAASTAGTTAKSLKEYKLQSIFFRTTNPSAMVNGKNVSVGSRIGAATVTSITREGVTLEAEGHTTVLELTSE